MKDNRLSTKRVMVKDELRKSKAHEAKPTFEERLTALEMEIEKIKAQKSSTKGG